MSDYEQGRADERAEIVRQLTVLSERFATRVEAAPGGPLTQGMRLARIALSQARDWIRDGKPLDADVELPS